MPELSELTDAEQRLCLFISLLDEDVTPQVIETLPADRRDLMRQTVELMLEEPPEREVVESVIDEFGRMFRMFQVARTSQNEVAQDTEPRANDSEAEDDAENAEDDGESDPVRQQMSLIDPIRLAVVLKTEQAQIIAIVLQELPEERAGEVLSHLPVDLRSAVLLKLNTVNSPSPRLVAQLLEATLMRAMELAPGDLEQEVPPEEKMARLLRTMSRPQRMETMDALDEEDEDLADAIRDKMFTFDDLALIDDRSIKSLLSEIDTETLSIALKSATPELMARVMGNLSRRAGDALAEEVEFMAPPSDEELTAAKGRIVEVIGKLDQDGQLSFME